MNLTNGQIKAVESFNKFGSLHVSGPRRSGKTTLLRHIIRSHPDKQFAVFCLGGYRMFKCLEYDKIENCFYQEETPKGEALTMLVADYVVGEELNLRSRDYRKPVICAYTRDYIEVQLENIIDDKQLEEMKACITDIHFQIEVGQYLN